MKATQKKVEHRAFDVELRAKADEPTQIVGYAAVFNQAAHGEVIRQGAFTKTLQEQKDIKAYWSHDRGQPLGRTTNGTLLLRQDEHGLYVEITPNPETTWGRNALAALERKDVTQMSFGFIPIQARVETIDGNEVYAIHEAVLREVSPVAEPWYEGTHAMARDNDDANAAATPEPREHSTFDAQLRTRELELIELTGV